MLVITLPVCLRIYMISETKHETPTENVAITVGIYFQLH